jgi:hypothetical protein
MVWLEKGSLRGPSGSSSWGDIQNRPSAFPPEVHRHSVSEIDGAEGFATTEQVGQAIDARFVVVDALPESRQPGVFYFLRET